MKYPNGILNNNKNHIIQYSNRGMSLEYDINISNEYYRDEDIAYIYKKPTPIQITKVDYPCRKKAIIKEAYFKEPSTTDYNGLYKGRYIDFEAQEINSSSVPLANIHKHQIKHIINIENNKGICFLIIRFNRNGLTYFLPAKKFIEFLNNNNRKSIPLEFFKNNAYEIETKYMPRLDYIVIVDKLMEVSQ